MQEVRKLGPMTRQPLHGGSRWYLSLRKMLGKEDRAYRNGVTAVTVALVLCTVPTWAVPYDGVECQGAIDFELSTTSTVPTLDETVSGYVANLPGWIKQECTDAFRVNLCGRLYAPYAEGAAAETTLCRNQCLDIAATCEKTATLDASLAILSPSQQCQGLNDDVCVTTGPLDPSLYAAGSCPAPLVVAERQRFKQYDGKIMSVQGTACVVGCPIHKTFYGESYLKSLDTLYLAWAAAGTICGTIILANLQPTGRRLYAWMFAFGSLCLNLLSVAYLASDYHNTLCDQGVGHLRRSLFMSAVGFGIHYCMLFCISWICLQTFAMWRLIHGINPSKIAEWKRYFTRITIFTPLAICAAPLIGQNYGWSVMAMLPFPLMLVEDTKAYFWVTFYAPIVVLVVLQLVLGAHAVYSFGMIIGRNFNRRSTLNRRKFWNIIRYNSEALVFIILIGLFTTITAGFVGYQTGYASFEFKEGHAYDGISCSRTDFYDLDIKYTALEVAYISSYGIIALIAFAPSTTAWKILFQRGAKTNSSATPNTELPPTGQKHKAVEMRTFPTQNQLSVLSSSSSEKGNSSGHVLGVV